MKEAKAPAHAPYLPKLPKEVEHEGNRIVTFQRALQASTDLMLGWTSIDGRPCYVRQMKNMKGGMPVDLLVNQQMHACAQVRGAILARCHARSGEPALVAGYCGTSGVLDRAIADWRKPMANRTPSIMQPWWRPSRTAASKRSAAKGNKP